MYEKQFFSDKTEWFLMDDKMQSVKIVQFIKDFQNEYPNTDVIVGTDAQNKGGNTMFVTAIVLVYPGNRGSRVLYTKDAQPHIHVIFDKLRQEAERSIQITEYLLENNILVTHIELDFQKLKSTKSTNAYKAYSGWIEAIGCQVLGKPDAVMAIAAADKLSK